MDRPRGRGARYQALDAWRGIVCLIVVLEHAGVALWDQADGATGLEGWVRHAVVTCLTLNLGAPLFFVISGYCIASSLNSTRLKGTKPALFLARRFWRIFPPYWASVAIIAILVLAVDRMGLTWLRQTSVGLELFSPADMSWSQWFGNLTLTETWRHLEFGSYRMLLNRVAWALCYQEQFYLICFLALVFFPNRLYRALGLATLAIVIFRVFCSDSGRSDSIRGLFPDLWHEFAVGLVLYWRINVAETYRSKRLVEVGLVALFAIGYQQEMVTTAAAAAFGLILVTLYRWDESIARIGRLDPLRACGRRSYAIYLIHLPVCTIGNAALAALGLSAFWPRAFLMVPAVTAASVGAGWLFYQLVDRRFSKLPTWRGLVLPGRPQLDVAPIFVEADSTSGIVRSWSP